MWLEGTNARVVGQAANCDEAIPIIERQHPHVVVMDMNMPGRDGVQCTHDLRERYPGLLVVGFTSSMDESVGPQMREADAVAPFHKPQLQGLFT